MFFLVFCSITKDLHFVTLKNLWNSYCSMHPGHLAVMTGVCYHVGISYPHYTALFSRGRLGISHNTSFPRRLKGNLSPSRRSFLCVYLPPSLPTTLDFRAAVWRQWIFCAQHPHGLAGLPPIPYDVMQLECAGVLSWKCREGREI